MLKFYVSDINEVAENLRSLYKQEGDKWVLQVEGAVSRVKLDEFRETNINLVKERDALAKKFEGVDPDDFRRLKGLETDLENGKLKGKEAEKILTERTEAMKAEHAKQMAAKEAELAKSTSELSRLKISEAAISTAIEKGLRPSAKDDLVARVSNVFRLVDGKPVPFNGDKEIYGTSGEVMTINEYVDNLVKNAAHLFEPSEGGGAGGGGAGGGGKSKGNEKVINPWKPETYNLTLQGRMIKENPEQARRLAAEAGKKLNLPEKKKAA